MPNAALIQQDRLSTSDAIPATSSADTKLELSANTAVAFLPQSISNGKHDGETGMTPEELAFMRSLGWNEDELETGGRFTLRQSHQEALSGSFSCH